MNNNNIRKTQRKNKTNQIINWPSNDSYFTIDSLVEGNKHMLTTSGLDITLRVRLNKAITEEKLVSVIGFKNRGKGRPQLVFAMRPINQQAINKAKEDGITIDIPDTTISVVNVVPQTSIKNTTPMVSPVQKTSVETIA